MEMAPDRIRYVLERPSVAAPGSGWTYCGGASALLGALISQGSGLSLADFAREALFAPLGISTFEWASGRDGVHAAASGLRLTARDLARIGELVAGLGRWAGRQIVPGDWIGASIRPAIPTGDGLEYGRQWFLGSMAVPVVAEEPQRWIAGFGNGGQRLFIMPSIATTAVVFGGKYNTLDAWVSPTRIWREIVVANVVDA
jgi:CubicO group peptidase (beta-lactamase class C family)